MLSLDDYFKSQSVTTLKNLYEAINSTDLTHMPTFNAYERRILSACSESDMFIEKFEQSDTQSMISSLDSKNKPIESPSSSHTSSSLSLSGNTASNTNGSQSLGSHQLSPVSTSSFRHLTSISPLLKQLLPGVRPIPSLERHIMPQN